MHEVVALEEKWKIAGLGERVRKAIAKVKARTVSAFAIQIESGHACFCENWIDSNDFNSEFFKQCTDFLSCSGF